MVREPFRPSASTNNYIFPVIGHLPVAEPKSRHFIDLLKGIEQKGLLEVTVCTRQQMCNIMRHTVHQGMIEHDLASKIGGVIAAPVKRHYSAFPLERLAELLSRIDGYYQGWELTRLAVSLTLHVFIRSSELRFARWTEISFRNKIWTIPATPEPIPGDQELVFPSIRNSVSEWSRILGQGHNSGRTMDEYFVENKSLGSGKCHTAFYLIHSLALI